MYLIYINWGIQKKYIKIQYYIIPLLATLDRCGVAVDGHSQPDNRRTVFDVVAVYAVLASVVCLLHWFLLFYILAVNN